MRWTRWPGLARDDAHLMRFVRCVTVAGAGSSVVYLMVLWNLRFDPGRTALPEPLYADFFDVQARAFLHGHLFVPDGALGIEAFQHGGHEYMYFAPGPALARMPLLLFTHAFDGHLTALSMLIAWVVTVTLMSMLVWRVRRVLRGRAALPMWEAVAYGILVVAVGAGSVLVYLASQPWVYHEAYAWAVAAALACAFALLGAIEKPSPERVFVCGAAMLLAVLSRATTGLAFGLAMFGTAAWFMTGRFGDKAVRYGRLLVVVTALPLLLGAAFNYAKFENPFLFDLKEQVWTDVNEHRQQALEENGGDLVSLDLIPSTATAYFRPDGVRLVPIPPFITFPQDPAGSVGGGFLDQTSRTGSTVPFMPALVALGTWGLVTAFRPRGPQRAAWVRPMILGSGAICGAIFVYGYIAYRYTAEILPVLAVTSAVGLVDLGHLFMLRTRRQRQVFVAGLGALAAIGVAANASVGLTTAAYSNPGADLTRYVAFQEAVSRLTPGDPLLGMTSVVDELPDDAEAEHLAILGDCDGLYVGQAETYWPWVPLEVKEVHLEVVLGPLPRELTASRRVTHRAADLLLGPSRPGGELALQVWRRNDGAFRIVYDSPRREEASDWIGSRPRTVDLRLVPKYADDEYDVLIDGESALQIPLSEFDDDWFRFQNVLTFDPTPRQLQAAGVGAQQLTAEMPSRCAKLLRQKGGTAAAAVAAPGRAGPTR